MSVHPACHRASDAPLQLDLYLPYKRGEADDIKRTAQEATNDLFGNTTALRAVVFTRAVHGPTIAPPNTYGRRKDTVPF